MKPKNVFSLFVVFAVGLFMLYNLPLRAESEDLKKVELEEISDIRVYAGGITVKFVDNSEDILISPGLETVIEDEVFIIKDPERFAFFNWDFYKRWRDDDYFQIVMGRDWDYGKIEFNAGGARIEGSAQADEFIFNTAGLEFSGDLTGEKITFNGAGMDIRGYLESKEVDFRGAGLNANLELVGVELLQLNGVGLNAHLKFLDTWSEERKIEASSLGGNLLISVPEQLKESGLLNVETSGVVNVDYDYFTD
ncbi:MAG: hypothetical protein ACOCQ1_05180 [Halanaerobiaceae bacterium]